MLSTKLKEAAGNSADATLYVDDVFSTYLYTGNGSTQTITNGIDLAGKGGLVWVKDRNSGAKGHHLVDTARGASKDLQSQSANGQVSTTTVSAFNSNGFQVGVSNDVNDAAYNYASWTFRKAAKFFDVVTFTAPANGQLLNIPHSLGVQPGFIIVKRTDAAANWVCYHRSLGGTTILGLNLTTASMPQGGNVIAPTASDFSWYGWQLPWAENQTAGTYVAYLFAHDTSSTGIIQCGSFTTDGSGNATVNLGWEPQYVMLKTSAIADGWHILDSMRGWVSNNGTGTDADLQPNTSNVESYGNGPVQPTSTGFRSVSGSASRAYVYMAIRRPNKPPTTGTQVFGLNARTGTGANATVTGGQTDDAVLIKNRGTAVADLFSSRLTGTGYLVTSSTAAEVAAGTSILQASPWDVMDGVKVGTTSTITNASANTFINYLFKRAPGFFDVVCYTGNGTSGTAITHNLGAIPELVIVKSRSAVTNWPVCCNISSTANTIYLNLTNQADVQTTRFPSLPTSTTFVIGNDNSVNTNAATYVAYLFATLAGIQYINSYVGDGTTGRVINCGFSAGARFICIKATSTTGSWWVWDSARGITSTNDPALQLNSTAAEITSADAIDPSSSGFIVNQEATCSINASGVSYLVWAIA